MTVEIITIQKTELEEMLQRAAKFGASIALDEIHTAQIPELMTKQDLSVYLRCNVSKINRLMKTGLPFVMFGDTPRFRKGDIDGWLKK